MTEAELQRQIVSLCRVAGWKVYRTHGGLNKIKPNPGNAGFPDLVLCKPGRGTIFAELKQDKGRVDVAQREWHEALVASGARVRVWRPMDWESIVEELGGHCADPRSDSDAEGTPTANALRREASVARSGVRSLRSAD